jgi:hypothetical protein
MNPGRCHFNLVHKSLEQVWRFYCSAQELTGAFLTVENVRVEGNLMLFSF